MLGYSGRTMMVKTVSIWIVKADATVVWEGKALSERASLIKALARRKHRGVPRTGAGGSPLAPQAQTQRFGVLA